MSRLPWILGIALVIGIVLLLFSFLDLQRVEREVDNPPPPDVKMHPYLAAEHLLSKAGHPVRSLSRLTPDSPFPPSDATLILVNDRNDFEHTEMAELIAWADGGGHLITFTRSSDLADPLLEAFGLTKSYLPLDEEMPEKGTINYNNKQFEVLLDSMDRLISTGDESLEQSLAELAFDPQDYCWAAHSPLGDGKVTILTQSGIWDNDTIRSGDHAALLLNLVEPGQLVWIVYEARFPPLSSLIWKRGWPLIITLLGCLVMLLWQRMPRLGPILPDPPLGRRRLLEHIEASSRFFWSRDLGLALATATRFRFQEHLRRKRPDWLALNAEKLSATLAEHSGLTMDQVNQCLMPGDLNNPVRFYHVIRWTETMRRAL